MRSRSWRCREYLGGEHGDRHRSSWRDGLTLRWVLVDDHCLGWHHHAAVVVGSTEEIELGELVNACCGSLPRSSGTLTQSSGMRVRLAPSWVMVGRIRGPQDDQRVRAGNARYWRYAGPAFRIRC